MYDLESVSQIAKHAIRTFKHAKTGFRVTLAHIKGPLCSASFVVPTASKDHRGLPHTLEHLIFMGSNTHPAKYLDLLATRCLSSGTNAYTTDDHTAYTITTGAREGMLTLLPVFLDHIVNPVLSDNHFITEIFHIDGSAKHQGVVYCEMASREHTESDLLDLNLRQMVYQNQSTLSFECGGLTKAIQKLNNRDIQEYHKQFYHLSNIHLLICGEFEEKDVFESLNRFEGFYQPLPPAVPLFDLGIPPPIQLPEKIQRREVRFPSSDENSGSIAYGWRGPGCDNYQHIMALEVLFMYLQETSASPLCQAFVERENPLATHVDFEIRQYTETCLMLVFSGVPREEGSETSDMEEEESEDGSSSEDMDEGSDKSEVEIENCFEPGAYHDHLMSTLQSAVASMTMDHVQDTLNRYRRKVMESLEEDPHGSIMSNLLPDIMKHAWVHQNRGTLHIGSRAKVFEEIETLSSFPLTFWTELAQKYIFDSTASEIFMIPDVELADKNSKEEQEDIKARAKQLGPSGLELLKNKVELAFAENQKPVPESVLQKMGPIPNVSGNPRIRNQSRKKNLSGVPFAESLNVYTDTLFYHQRIALNTEHVPTELRPYFVLFQELLFQSPVFINGQLMPYTQVSEKIAQLAISHEAAIGFGNDLWHCSWLSDMFMVSMSCELKTISELQSFVLAVLFKTQFTEERMQTQIKNLLNELVELKRSGSDMVTAVSTRMTCMLHRDQFEGNEAYISIFKQEEFLKQVLQKIKSGQGQEVIQDLERLRAAILLGPSSNQRAGFVQFSGPVDFSLEQHEEAFLKAWKQEMAFYSPSTLPAYSSPFPYPRSSYDPLKTDTNFSNAVMIPIPGLQTSYLFQCVACDVWDPVKTKDYYAVSLLSEMCGRTEGPLYSSIRGQGYAYGVSLDTYLFSGQLVFSVHDSSEPAKSLNIFYDLLKKMGSNGLVSFKEFCNPREMDTAKAGILFRWVNSRATCTDVIGTLLRNQLRGYGTLEQEESLVLKSLNEMTVEDLFHVYQKYFVLFLDPSKRKTIMTTPQGESVQQLQEEFLKNAVPFKQQQLDDFKILF